MEEMFDVYTREGEYLGVRPKSYCHSVNPNCYHKPVWVWIINDNKEILIQKRADCKKVCPNKWDISSAGHVLAGESSLEGAIREVYEELGIKTVEEEYQFLFEYIYDKAYEIAQVYLLKNNTSIDEMHLQKEEVSDVKWIKFEDFKNVLYSKEFAPTPDEFKIKMLDLINELKSTIN